MVFRNSCKAILKWIDKDVDQLSEHDLEQAVNEVKIMLHICDENISS